MVDVSAKPPLLRVATAEGAIRLRPSTIRLVRQSRIAKGNVLATARIAGIQAAKRTGELIPLCHPLPVEHVDIEFEVGGREIRIRATARITAKTGVEMEALTAVAVAGLTIYDMCKAVDKSMVLGKIRLVSKTKSESP